MNNLTNYHSHCDFCDGHDDIMGNHGANAQGQAADAADEGKKDAAHGQTADEGGAVIDKVGRENQNR